MAFLNTCIKSTFLVDPFSAFVIFFFYMYSSSSSIFDVVVSVVRNVMVVADLDFYPSMD